MRPSYLTKLQLHNNTLFHLCHCCLENKNAHSEGLFFFEDHSQKNAQQDIHHHVKGYLSISYPFQWMADFTPCPCQKNDLMEVKII